MKILLASASPRRNELLKTLFSDFDVEYRLTDENSVHRLPSCMVKEIAHKKALPFVDELDRLVISADTIVYRRRVVYNKPKNAAEAVEMLRALAGKTHKVYTGVCFSLNGKTRCFSVVSRVVLKKLADAEIDRYIKSGSPFDKAGAYGIQDGVAVKKYRGSYSNIMGLPLERLKKELGKYVRVNN